MARLREGRVLMPAYSQDLLGGIFPDIRYKYTRKFFQLLYKY
jgi:hypothetical protein